MISVSPFQLDRISYATTRAADFTNFAQAVVEGKPFNYGAASTALIEALAAVAEGFDDLTTYGDYPQVYFSSNATAALAGSPANDRHSLIGVE